MFDAMANNLILKYFLLVFIVVKLCAGQNTCQSTPTTVSGSQAPRGRLCKGQLLLNEQFNSLNSNLWKHDVTLAGGNGNWEFQWYTNNRKNSFINDGKLFIRPTLTKDEIGEDGLSTKKVTLNGCTNSAFYGCERQGTTSNIINPIQSARLQTAGTFHFKYGRMEIIAKMPTGDWLWPAIWLLPTHNIYGEWPRSGEIDLVEGRGNNNYVNSDRQQIGVEHSGSTLHFGPAWNMNGFLTAQFSSRTASNNGYNKAFHKYQLEWSPQSIKFFIDDQQVGNVNVGNGFWSRGHFQGQNIWSRGSKSAPFDQEFYIILNLAVGGTNGYFPDQGTNARKPWSNSSPRASTDFWNGRSQWLPTWHLDENYSYDASLIIDSVKVWAL